MGIPRLRERRAGARADKRNVESLTIECLGCGHQRPFAPSLWRDQDAGECARCAYVGWADVADLTEGTRRLLRDLPLDRRLTLRTV